MNMQFQEVFAYVSPKEICRSSQVCKDWRNLLNNDHFNNHIWRIHAPWAKADYYSVYKEAVSQVQQWKEDLADPFVQTTNYLKDANSLQVVSHPETYEPRVYVTNDNNGELLVITTNEDEVESCSNYEESNHLLILPEYTLHTNTDFQEDLHSHSHFLVVLGKQSYFTVVDIIDTSIGEIGEIVRHIKFPEEINAYPLCVRFSQDGQFLFISTKMFDKPGGVAMWDVEKGQLVSKFDKPIEKNGEFDGFFNVCPMANNQQFLSSSYNNIYYWDVRSGEIIQTMNFNSEEDQSHRACRMSNVPIKMNFIKQDTELFVSCSVPSKSIVYSFPDCVPTLSQFSYSKFLTVHVDDYKGFGIGETGDLYLLDCLTKESDMLGCLKLDKANTNALCHFNTWSDTIAVHSGELCDGVSILSFGYD